MPVVAIWILVFPTQVGVILYQRRGCHARRRIPHASGGDPIWTGIKEYVAEYSPRKWG